MRLFLSIPTQAHKLDNGGIEPDFVGKIENLANQLRLKGHDVFCVIERDHWAVYSAKSPKEQFQIALDKLKASDKSIVFLDGPISPGVEIELGFAYANKIPIEMYQIGKPAWSNMALGILADSKVYKVQDVKDFAQKVLQNNS